MDNNSWCDDWDHDEKKFTIPEYQSSSSSLNDEVDT